MKRKLALLFSVFGGVTAPLAIAASCSQQQSVTKSENSTTTAATTEEKTLSPEEVAKVALVKESTAANENLIRMSENVLVLLKESAKMKNSSEASKEDVYLEFGELYFDMSKSVKQEITLVSTQGTAAKFVVQLSKTLSNNTVVSVSKEVEVNGYKEAEAAEQ
ncbi:hypothetical protein [Mycoplasmopsis columboralis]|uniref:Lipoprotein n=1 Tax=Mycoplasmopsis columboralis TaxID=171282 RepID=A0A449B7B2_9BACT|nr:hypothetical protein [Mycoplasmopsis columboralis]VEU76475.1 Uncharacterised protein [Mycoplasmopsis columboralis]